MGPELKPESGLGSEPEPEPGPHVLYVRFHSAERAPLGEEVYSRLLDLLRDVTPTVEALPPEAALMDVRGALRYFGRDAVGLAEIVRLRALARHGVDCTIGVAANPLLARMAAAPDAGTGAPGALRPGAPGSYARPGAPSRGVPGVIRTVPDEPEAVAAFLARKPAAALHGVGPATARTLCSYGLDSVARIGAVPLGTLQRILGAGLGRRLHERARGIDPTPVTPNAPARSTAAEHHFGRDELDTERQRRALLTLSHELGSRLRVDGQVTRGLTLTVRYADRSTTTRTRALPEPTAHTPSLTAAVYALHAALGLQRARVRSVSLRAEDLAAAELAVRQLSFDPDEEDSRRIEAAVDRARARFGPQAAYPASALDAA
ncbi:DNA polymerase Y family protein [Streptomyces sp. H27-D2]|uniref:DNA polymerase Y family protein n=1 Tax=Streptomyces sp. H27-D2 TaxID=3046304 RepID=UPI003FA7782A